MPKVAKDTNVAENINITENSKSTDITEVELLKKKLEELMATVNSLQTPKITTLENIVDKNSDISITSLYNGILNLCSEGRATIKFEKFGDTRIIPRETINEYLSSNMSFFENGYFYVHSDELIKRYNFENLYKNLLTDNVIKKITEYSENDIRSLVTNAPESQKNILCDILVEKYANNEISDISKFALIDKCCNNKDDDTIIARGEFLKKTRNAINQG